MKKIFKIILLMFIFSISITSCNNQSNKSNVDKDLDDNKNTTISLNKYQNNKLSYIKDPNDIINVFDEEITKFEDEFFIENRNHIKDNIKNNSILVLFSDFNNENKKYTPNRNFYYLTGIDEENSILFLTNIDGKIKETLYIEKRDEYMEKWIGKSIDIKEAKNISGVENIKYIDEFYDDFNNYIATIENIYLDLNHKNITNLLNNSDTYKSRGEEFALNIYNKYPKFNIINIYNTIGEIRSIKTDDEIKNIKMAIDITNEGIKSIMRNIKPQLKEYQVESYFDYSIKYLGANEFSFPTIAASGKNASVLHYDKNNDVLKNNELILLDLGASFDYYSSDISRTLPINGKFTTRQKMLYNIVLKAQEKTINSVKPGITLRELNDITSNILANECKKIGLIKNENEINKYYYHAVGHSLGLDTHDPGINNRKLEPGMVITIEPGLYIQEEGIGIRIEDDILVTESGNINLSENIIKDVEDIENFMKSR